MRAYRSVHTVTAEVGMSLKLTLIGAAEAGAAVANRMAPMLTGKATMRRQRLPIR
jgi:hypothetical protein